MRQFATPETAVRMIVEEGACVAEGGQTCYAGRGVDRRQRQLLLTVRQGLLMTLGALEDYLDMERSVVPKHRRG